MARPDSTPASVAGPASPKGEDLRALPHLSAGQGCVLPHRSPSQNTSTNRPRMEPISELPDTLKDGRLVMGYSVHNAHPYTHFAMYFDKVHERWYTSYGAHFVIPTHYSELES